MHAWSKEHVVHGDIKPDNFVVDMARNTVYVIDLESVVFVGPDDDTAPRGKYFSAKYASPEVCDGSVSLWSDLYSFGVMLANCAKVGGLCSFGYLLLFPAIRV